MPAPTSRRPTRARLAIGCCARCSPGCCRTTSPAAPGARRRAARQAVRRPVRGARAQAGRRHAAIGPGAAAGELRPRRGRRRCSPAAAPGADASPCCRLRRPGDRPSINAAAIRVLTRHGIEVVVAEEGCCGSLVHHIGREQEALAAARRHIDAWTAEIDGRGPRRHPGHRVGLRHHGQGLRLHAAH